MQGDPLIGKEPAAKSLGGAEALQEGPGNRSITIEFLAMARTKSVAALRLTGVTVRLGATTALAGVDFSLAPGRVHALVGENGAGKSTLLKVIAGTLRPDAGALVLAGQPYAPTSPAAAQRAGVGMIHQELALAPHLSVADNLVLGDEPRRGPLLDRAAARERARSALRELGRGDMPLDARVGRLPIAEQQIVEVARAVASGCEVLLFDEPTSCLGRDDVERLLGLVRRLRDAGRAIAWVSHALDEVRAVADEFTVLRDGRVAGVGPIADATDDRLIAMMVGRTVSELFPRSPRRAGDVLLEVEGLSGRDKPRAASLTLRRGEVVGIAGLMGAGRSELLRALFGLDEIAAGRVRVAAALRGEDAGPAARWRQGVGLVSEDRRGEGLALQASVAENLTLPRLRGLGPAGLVLPRRRDAAARRWVDEVGIKCASPRQRAGALSGGNQQKVALARLLHADADLWLLDEPTRGIDVAAKAEVYRLIDALAVGDRSRGRAPCGVLMASSYLPELFGVCDRIAVMRSGRLGPARPVADLDPEAVMREATAPGGAP
jgi:ribose transport system ATP-binding protein